MCFVLEYSIISLFKYSSKLLSKYSCEDHYEWFFLRIPQILYGFTRTKGNPYRFVHRRQTYTANSQYSKICYVVFSSLWKSTQMFGADQSVFWSAGHVSISCLEINHMSALHFKGHNIPNWVCNKWSIAPIYKVIVRGINWETTSPIPFPYRAIFLMFFWPMLSNIQSQSSPFLICPTW